MIRDLPTFAFGFSNQNNWEDAPGGGPAWLTWGKRQKCLSLPVASQALLLQNPHSEHEVRCKADEGEVREETEHRRGPVTAQPAG